ncbi:unnamed protein product [Caenorhabditis angaria]|uniref:Uncharacterized protein n=1 Tax=Caenorhabditis angaria TaxID=860376 RepID=A0A9P1IQ98_9PELO|nr:unnamed protein product [Caenorhabditis angaria]
MSERNWCKLICHINVRIGWTIFGILFGISAFLTYSIKFQNWSSTATCFIATLFACQTLYLYWGMKKGTIINWPEWVFHAMVWPNIIIGALGLIGMIVCFVIAGINKQGAASMQDMYGENLWFTGSWSFVITKWTWQNAYFSRNHLKMLNAPQPEIESIGDANPAEWKY